MKFSIRDLLLVTVIVALVIGAWLDRQFLATENARLQKEVAEKDRILYEIIGQLSKVNSKITHGGVAEDVNSERRHAMQAELDLLRNSSAPTPNPPKK